MELTNLDSTRSLILDKSFLPRLVCLVFSSNSSEASQASLSYKRLSQDRKLLLGRTSIQGTHVSASLEIRAKKRKNRESRLTGLRTSTLDKYNQRVAIIIMSGLRAPRDSLSTTTSSGPRDSSVPLLQREALQDGSDSTQIANISHSVGGGQSEDSDLDDNIDEDQTKSGKRRLFGLGKKKDEMKSPLLPSTQSAIAAMRPVSPIRQPPKDIRSIPAVTSPAQSFVASSSSPQGSSLASSQIFERNVQESTVPSEISQAIPSHIQTEDQIPPALEASSLAITDSRLDPDDVEIVTHAAHHTAASGIAEGTSSAMQSDTLLPLSPQDSQHESIYSALSRHTESADNDTASTYGALDPNDVKRLSFISFADVVQAEHAETGSMHNMPMSSSSLAQGRTRSPVLDRSPSPMRSPGSSHSQSFSQGTTTPPIGSHPASMKGSDLSPGRSPVGTPLQHGELTIETMRQALRRTGSGDLGAAVRSGSLPVSAVGGEDEASEKTPFK